MHGTHEITQIKFPIRPHKTGVLLLRVSALMVVIGFAIAPLIVAFLYSDPWKGGITGAILTHFCWPIALIVSLCAAVFEARSWRRISAVAFAVAHVVLAVLLLVGMIMVMS
ncbi:MAG: hypothetical protein WD009_14745 [Phycisphaeraceae bacterium]